MASRVEDRACRMILLVICLVYASALKTEAIFSSSTSVCLRSTRRSVVSMCDHSVQSVHSMKRDFTNYYEIENLALTPNNAQ